MDLATHIVGEETRDLRRVASRRVVLSLGIDSTWQYHDLGLKDTIWSSTRQQQQHDTLVAVVGVPFVVVSRSYCW
jgi:hypothetical protein